MQEFYKFFVTTVVILVSQVISYAEAQDEFCGGGYERSDRNEILFHEQELTLILDSMARDAQDVAGDAGRMVPETVVFYHSWWNENKKALDSYSQLAEINISDRGKQNAAFDCFFS